MLQQKIQIQIQREIMSTILIVERSETIAQIKANTKNWDQYVPELPETRPIKAQIIKQHTQAAAEELLALFSQFFQPYSVSFSAVLSEKPTVEEKAFNLYANKDYAKALPLLKQITNNNKAAALMLGNALLITKEYEAAYTCFEQLIEEKSISYAVDAHWYAGLTLLYLNRVNEAKLHLEKIIIDENADKDIQLKAIEILNKVADISL